MPPKYMKKQKKLGSGQKEESMFTKVLAQYGKRMNEIQQREMIERERSYEERKRLMPTRKEWNRLAQQFEQFEEEMKCFEREVRSQQTKRGIEARKSDHAA